MRSRTEKLVGISGKKKMYAMNHDLIYLNLIDCDLLLDTVFDAFWHLICTSQPKFVKNRKHTWKP